MAVDVTTFSDPAHLAAQNKLASHGVLPSWGKRAGFHPPTVLPRCPRTLQSWQKIGSQTRVLSDPTGEASGAIFPIHPHIHLSVSFCLPTYLSSFLPFFLSLFLPACLSVSLSDFLSCTFTKDRRKWAAGLHPRKAGLLVLFASCSGL